MSQSLESAIAELLQNSKKYLGSDAPVILLKISRQSRYISDMAKLHLWCGDEKRLYVVSYHFEDDQIIENDKSGDEKRLYVVSYRPFLEAGEKHVELLERKVKQMSRLHEAYAGSEKFSVIKPIAFFPRFRAIVTEESPGTELDKLTRRQIRLWENRSARRTLEAPFRQCGAWLKSFQALPNEFSNERLNIDELLAYIQWRLDRLQSYGDLAASFSEAIIRNVAKLSVQVHPADLKMVAGHGDFGPHNVLLDGEKITIMDMEGAKAESIYFDLANFYEELEKLTFNPLYSHVTVRRLQSVFLAGYDLGFDERNPLFTIFRIRQIVCHLLGWRGRLEKSFLRLRKYRWALKRYRRLLSDLCEAVQ